MTNGISRKTDKLGFEAWAIEMSWLLLAETNDTQTWVLPEGRLARIRYKGDYVTVCQVFFPSTFVKPTEQRGGQGGGMEG